MACSHIALSFRLLLFLSFLSAALFVVFLLSSNVLCMFFMGSHFFFYNAFVEDGVVEIFIPLLHFPECCTIQVCSSECLSSHIIMFLR